MAIPIPKSVFLTTDIRFREFSVCRKYCHTWPGTNLGDTRKATKPRIYPRQSCWSRSQGHIWPPLQMESLRITYSKHLLHHCSTRKQTKQFSKWAFQIWFGGQTSLSIPVKWRKIASNMRWCGNFYKQGTINWNFCSRGTKENQRVSYYQWWECTRTRRHESEWALPNASRTCTSAVKWFWSS